MLSKTYTKYIQSLHHKKFRDAAQAFIAEGGKVVMELIESSNIVCEHLVGKEAWLNEQEPLIRKHFKGPLEIVDDVQLSKVSALVTPNQVLGVFKKKVAGAIIVKERITLALDTLQDPGNLGTIIRIADWFGVETIVCSENCADMYNPKTVQSTMGSLARVNIVYTDLAAWLKKQPAVEIYAAAITGENITNMQPLKEGILLIGNESKGISDELMQLAGRKITIPRLGQAESLNAAVATGILLSHLSGPRL